MCCTAQQRILYSDDAILLRGLRVSGIPKNKKKIINENIGEKFEISNNIA
jgi:hypothetical protein